MTPSEFFDEARSRLRTSRSDAPLYFMGETTFRAFKEIPMTDIDSMEAGPEMDRLVAEKVMGITFAAGTDWELGDDGRVIGPVYAEERDAMGWHYWSPSTNIAHAWEVVEKLKDHREWHIENDQGEIREWIVEILSLATGRRYSTDSASVPLAICRAALKAMG